MASEPARPDPGAAERLLDGLLEANSLDAVIDVGVRALASTSEAQAVAIFLLDNGALAAERWHRAEAVPAEVASALRAHAVAQASGASYAGAPAGSGPAGVAMLPLTSHGRTLGIAALIGAPEPAATESVSRAAAAIACRAGAEIEVLRAREVHQRYERWFKTLDEQ